MNTVSHSHRSPHPADAFWKILRAFTEIDWLVGAGNYRVAQHEGRTARVLSMDTPIVEFLLGCDDERRELRYGVVKNPFVPVDNYRATVSVKPGDGGCAIHFGATFDLDEVPFDQVSGMLTAAYQMMAARIDLELE